MTRDQQAIVTCETCDDLHWVDDPTACGDEEHCSPIMPCPTCNPNGEIE